MARRRGRDPGSNDRGGCSAPRRPASAWSPETQLSSYVPGYRYIEPYGFKFPFGDYFEMDIDNRGDTQAVWGEGLTYESPGSIWYTRGR